MELKGIYLELTGLSYIMKLNDFSLMLKLASIAPVPSPPLCLFPALDPDVEGSPLLNHESPLGPLLQFSPEYPLQHFHSNFVTILYAILYFGLLYVRYLLIKTIIKHKHI